MRPMSEEELIGRLGGQYKEAKERLARLESEALQFSKALAAITEILGGQRYPNAATSTLDTHLAIYPSIDDLKTLLAEISKAETSKQAAKAELIKLGFEMK